MSGIEILISDRWGIYIPQHFAENFILWDGVTDKDREVLESGPENELYWDTWDSITSDATFTDENGNVWRLYQDGDLFAYCEKLMDDDEYYGFFGEHRSDLDREDRLENDKWYDTTAEV